MKIFVKRDRFKTYQKAKIELDYSEEWGIISTSLKTELKSTIESIEFYETLKNDNSDNYNSGNHQWYVDRKERIEKMIESLELKNEKSWK